MIAENIRELVLEDTTFDEARQNFNRVLQKLFRSMIDSKSADGSITLKIDVSMVTEYIPNTDPDIEGESREIQKPSFKHKVSSAVTVKDELSGNKNPEMEPVWDDEKQMYVLQYIANTGQRSIFDKDAAWNQEQGGDGQDSLETDPEKTWMNTPQIEGPVADEHALPGEVQGGGVIDGDFREVNDGTGGAETGDSPEDEENTGDADGNAPDGENEADGDGYEYDDPEE